MLSFDIDLNSICHLISSFYPNLPLFQLNLAHYPFFLVKFCLNFCFFYFLLVLKIWWLWSLNNSISKDSWIFFLVLSIGGSLMTRHIIWLNYIFIKFEWSYIFILVMVNMASGLRLQSSDLGWNAYLWWSLKTWFMPWWIILCCV